jgi:hypothetical protein
MGVKAYSYAILIIRASMNLPIKGALSTVIEVGMSTFEADYREGTRNSRLHPSPIFVTNTSTYTVCASTASS